MIETEIIESFDTQFIGNIYFAHGFEAAMKSYRKMSFLERLFCKPLGLVRLDYRDSTCSVDYNS